MADPTFRARIRPELHPAAAELVAVYEAVPGALTYPGCMPEALAEVLDALTADDRMGLFADEIGARAALLRGEQS